MTTLHKTGGQTPGTPRGLILSAPASGSGKTTITLGILRALARRGFFVRSAKSGPDYIDPRFHAAASGRDCVNLDAWAMTPERLVSLAAGDGLLLIEGAMGLFDGAPPDGQGATADLARHLGLPVVLVLDCARQSQSIAALVRGFQTHRAEIRIVGLILNNVGSPRHEEMLRRALDETGLPVIGALARDPGMAHPARHLGLVQAAEHADLERFLNRAGDHVATSLDLALLQSLATPLPVAPEADRPHLPPPAQRIAIASDQAFAFAYPHLLADWRKAGAVITFFSPLQNQAPPEADLILLPGGYPELHAGRIAAATTFINGLKKASYSTDIYGECGGYMVMGSGLIDAAGKHHEMAGLLALETSFAHPRLHLGYRRLRAEGGVFPGCYRGHEFHYATTLMARGEPLFQAFDAADTPLAPMGLIHGRCSGSFAHLIDREP